jgi:hypothetical protein
MKSIIPTYLTVIGFCFIMLLGSSLIALQLQISGARSFHAACVNRLQSSYYADAVETACEKEAEARGYNLKIESVAVYKGRESKLITIEYPVIIPFITSKAVTGTITGYGK